MSDVGVPPVNAVEQALLEIWTEVLDVREVGTDSDFFDLGGRSRHAMQIVARAREAFGLELAPDAVFQSPTVAELARDVEAAQGVGPPPSPTPSRPSEPVLSPGQEEIWCTGAYTPHLRPHTPQVYRLTGRLDVGALEQALGEVARRHESLRTVFPDATGRPRAVVLPPEPVTVPVSDLTGVPRRQREAEASRRVWEVVSEPFELSEQPPWRAELLRLEPTVHVFALSLHEILCDGWSLGLLSRELSVLYGSFVSGRPSPLPDLPLQYSHAAAFLAAERPAHREYWKQALSGAPLTLAFPWQTAGQPLDPSEREQQGRAQRSVQLAGPLSRRLQELVREESITEFMLYLTAFFVLLHRYTDEDDLLVVSPTANRPRAEFESLIGFFARNVPLRARLDDDPSFRTLLQRTRQAVLDASAHAGGAPLHFDRLAEAGGPRGLRALWYGFRTSSATDNPLGESLELAGIRVAPYGDEQRPGTHLWLSVSDEPGRSRTVELNYDEGVPDRATVDRMLRSYVAILASGAENPDARVSSLKALSPDDRRKLMTEWKHRAPGGAPDQCVHDLVSAQAHRTPDAVAVSSPSGDLTYRELGERANQLAHHLQARGVASKATVGVAMDPSAAMVVAMLAVLKAGCACLPLPPTGDESAHGAAVRLDALIANGVVAAFAGMPSVVVDLAREAGEIDAASRDDPEGAVDPDDRAFVIHTAGVTAPPKVVLLPHRAVVAAATWFKRGHRLGNADRAVHLPGPGALSWALAPWPYLAGGGAVVVPEGTGDEPAAGRADWLDRHGVTVASVGPRVASGLLRAEAGERRLLRTLMVAGAGELELPQDGVPGKPRVIRQYAIAEAAGVVMSAPAAAGTAGAATAIGTPASSSAPAFVLDRHLNLVPIGVTGELYLGGEVLADGYAQSPVSEGEAFIPDPFSARPGSRLLRTGDLARRRPDGTIELLGRKHDEVGFRGFRLTPRLLELEAALQTHPGIRAAATGWDPEEEQITAYLVLGEGPDPSESDLNAWIQENVKRWLLPRRYAIVDSLPRRGGGTPDRQALVDLPSRWLDGDAVRTGPRTRRERKLASIWEELLGRRDIGVHDNFFLVGGNAVLGVEMIARSRAAGIELTPQALISSRTIAELAIVAGDAPRKGKATKPRRPHFAFWQRRASSVDPDRAAT